MDVFYWRDGSSEVDFILRYRQQYAAIEVKSNSTQNTAGLNAFKQKFKPKTAFIVGEEGIPLESFLQMDIKKFFDEK